MPHQIFRIDEILRIIVWYTREISDSTAISFACCCKAFEEPVLSLLWTYKSFEVLVKLLPPVPTHESDPASPRLDQDEWKRFRRYASWIRVLSVDVTQEHITQQLTPLLEFLPDSPSPPKPTQHVTGTVLPNLHGLIWTSNPSFLRYLPLFLSPILTDFRIRIANRWGVEFIPGDYAPLAHTITSMLSPSILQSFCLYMPPNATPSPELKQAAAELVLRCGPPLTCLEVELELPESAILHLMSLPNLTIWRAAQSTPTALLSSPLRPTVAFSEVTYLALDTTTPRRWLSFLDCLVSGNSHSSSPTPSLWNAPHTTAFGNLTHFDMDAHRRRGCTESCTFLLADSDVSLLADTLPRLEWLHLGFPCGFNTCQTTFRSLYTLSTQCPRLRHVCVHLNTTTLIQDILSVFEEQERQSETDGPNSRQNLRRRRNYPLDLRFAHYLPLESNVEVGDLGVVSKGLFDIFVMIPDVIVSGSNGEFWTRVSQGIKTLQAGEGSVI